MAGMINAIYKELIQVDWWLWLLIAAGIAVALILEGAFRVLREQATKYRSELVQVRTDAEERLVAIRKKAETSHRPLIAISLTPNAHAFGKSREAVVTIQNDSNGPIGCHVEGTLLSATVPVNNAHLSYTVKWIDKEADDQEMNLFVGGDKAVLEIASFGTKPFFRFGPHFNYYARFGWAEQLVFHVANKAHPAFMENVPRKLVKLSLEECASLLRDSRRIPPRDQIAKWEVKPNTRFVVRLRASYWSLIDRTVSGVETRTYAIDLGPLMSQMHFEEVNDEKSE